MAKNMYQKREERKQNKESNIEVSNSKTNINWYPGHMVKAQNEIKLDLKLIDIVIEVLDARIPISSQNPIINNLSKDKSRLVILNKADLADKIATKNWKNYFEKQGVTCVLTNASSGENIKNVIEAIKKIGKDIYDKKDALKTNTININHIYRVLIVGIPNVGKSTLINKIANKQVANVGNKPGITKKKQWIKVANNIDLLDTPGLLWPKFEDQSVGIKLALTGNIKQEILDIEFLACEGIKMLSNNITYKETLKNRYCLIEKDFEMDPYDILEKIGRKKGCLISGGNVNMEKVCKIFLDEFKSGKIGNITLDNV
ncbi:MAG: ribosome biogenesis GTPase YlqF [Clostridia bacterium]